MSSAALVEPAVETAKTTAGSPEPALSLTGEVTAQAESDLAGKTDPHPLVPVFILGGVAFLGTLAFVGAILMWLTLRNSGVMAP